MKRLTIPILCVSVCLAAGLLTAPAQADITWKADPGIADTVVIPSIDWRGDTVAALNLATATDDSLAVAQIVLAWTNPAFRLDSVKFNVGRWNVPGYHRWTKAGSDTAAVVAFLPTQKRLPPGSGPVARLYFGRDSAYTFDADFSIGAGVVEAQPPLASYELLFADVANDPFLPTEINTATIAYSPCFCEEHGEISGDGFFTAIDLNDMIDDLFFNSPLPAVDPDCPHIHRGDLNCDNIYDALDLNWLIDLLFFNGVGPCDPCEDLP